VLRPFGGAITMLDGKPAAGSAGGSDGSSADAPPAGPADELEDEILC